MVPMATTTARAAAWCVLTGLVAVPVWSAGERLLIASFETAAELALWQVSGEAQLSAEHATDGARSLRVRWPEGKGMLAGGFPADWSGWEVLKVDCYNPGPPFTMTLRVDDETGATISSWYHYVRTGNTTLEVVVPGLAEKVDVSRIRAAHLRVDPVSGGAVEAYFDNVRLTRGEAPEVFRPPVTREKPIPEQAQNLLPHGDFENGLQGWEVSGEEGGGQYDFGTGAGEHVHSGMASAAVICRELGEAVLRSTPIVLPAEDVYTLTFWVKGVPGGRIRYGLESMGLEDVREGDVGEQWQQVNGKFVCAEGQTARVVLYDCAPGTVYFDEVRLAGGWATAERLRGARGAPEDPANLVANPNFELGLQGWGSWGQWDGGRYGFGSGEGTNAYSGGYSAAVYCQTKGRGGIFTQPIKLQPDEYTLRFMAKASQPSSIRYGIMYPGGQLFRDAEIAAGWKEFTLSVTVDREGSGRVYLMSTGEGTVYFDEVSLKGTRAAPAPAGPVESAAAPTQLVMRGGHTYVNGQPFFALGVYRARPEDLKGTAFNCIPGWDLPTATTLEACAAADIYVLPDLTGVLRGHLPHRVGHAAKPLMNHPAVLAWYVCDEPDHERWPVPPDEMRLATRLLHDLDPHHLTCSVVMPWAESNLYRYADTVDILMTDIYPISGEHPADLGSIWRSTAVMRRAVNDQKPIWVVIQATAQGTPEEHVAAAYLAVVEGADGLFFWEYEDGHSKPEVWQSVCQIARELRTLAPVLTSDDAPQQATASTNGVRLLRKAGPRGDILIAINGTGAAVPDCTLTVPSARDGVAEVLFEERSVPVANGVLTDDFAPFERHVYQLP